METPLIERISGHTFKIVNLLHNRTNIRAYVEDDADVPFWYYYFSKQKMPVIITAVGNDKRGKQIVLNYADRLSKEFILCVDSDFDYLHQRKTEQSKLIIDNQFIFHTYLHSIENYKCYASILNNVIVGATNTTENINFNFINFLENYSEKIYEIFIYFIYFEQKYKIEEELYTKEREKKQVELSEIQFNEWEIIQKPIHKFLLDDGINKIKNEINKLPSIEPDILSKLKDDLMILGVSKINTYLFIKGHTLMDNVVLRFLTPIYRRIISQRISNF